MTVNKTNQINKFIEYDGTIVYYNAVNGELHRTDGPAVINWDGSEEWWVNGCRHRVDGPALIDTVGELWYFNGERHRADGPAVIYSNVGEEWWFEGKLHREDGPATISPDGKETYWVNGEKKGDLNQKMIHLLFNNNETRKQQ